MVWVGQVACWGVGDFCLFVSQNQIARGGDALSFYGYVSMSYELAGLMYRLGEAFVKDDGLESAFENVFY